MKVTTTEDIRDLMSAHIASAAFCTALELGLFWRLAEQPEDAAGIAQVLKIPPIRCKYWLELLVNLGLLERVSDKYSLSSIAHDAIINVYSKDTWALLAEEARERFPAVQDLALHIKEPGSVWTAQGLKRPNYVSQMERSLERARRFTRMLYEIHQPLAEELAQTLDMTGVNHLMDLGGGSGVVSVALLRRYPDLTAVVVDMANVCMAAREMLAAQKTMETRIRYHAADFFEEKLPIGFDFVLECDVGIYNEALFAKVRSSLNAGGRFGIVDYLAPANGVAPPWQVVDAFEGSLENTKFSNPTLAKIEAILNDAKFDVLSVQSLSNGRHLILAERE